MGPNNGKNLSKVSYFPLEEYVKRIKLTDDVLYHAEDTGKDFDKYISELKKYSPLAIIYFLIESFSDEMINTNMIENHIIDPLEIIKKNIFYDSLHMNNKRIKELNQFVTRSDAPTDYRKSEVRVSSVYPNGEEIIYWYGANPEDIKKFMTDFLELYHRYSPSMIGMNPFLKSALCHLLFTRIHPFSDGNGRTARIIHTIKFTDMINHIYGSNLKISPLHLSKSILLNKPTYLKRINEIYFDLEHDSNEEINKYLDYMLDMNDEQIFYMSNHLKQIEDVLKRFEENPNGEEIEQMAKKMRLKR